MTRQEAIKQLKGDITESCATFSNQWEKDEEAISVAISALSENKGEDRPKGQWIMTSDYLTTAYGSVDYVKCSCCGEDSLEEGDYCPNCGARMKGGE